MNEKKSGNPYSLQTNVDQLSIKMDKEPKQHGSLTLLTGTVFIIGEVAGGGLLSLSYAVAGAGWFGLGLIVWCCANAGFAGICLAKCWLILEERYPEYKFGLTRKPFATIGDKAFGRWASVAVSLCMSLTRFGATTVFTLIIAGLLQSIMSGISAHSLTHLGICSWIPIVGLTLTPFTWLGSPGDFWPAAYTAMISTMVGCVLLLVNMGLQAKDHMSSASYDMPTFKVSSFPSEPFCFLLEASAGAFPTFQNDMKNKSEFPKAVTYGFMGLLLLYIPVAGGGYIVFGSGLETNIIKNMNRGAITTIIEFCFLLHCFFAVLIILNPVLLELEEIMNIPKKFNIWRVVFRTSMMIGVIFTGESVPTFGRILDLIGGSTVTLQAFIMPPLFYMKLCSDRSGDWPEHKIPLSMRIIMIQIIVVGVVGGIASTYSSLDGFLNPSSKLEPACYVGRTNDTYYYN